MPGTAAQHWYQISGSLLHMSTRNHENHATEKIGVFIPSWAASITISVLLFAAGMVTAYFHQQGVTEQRIAVLEAQNKVLEKSIDKLGLQIETLNAAAQRRNEELLKRLEAR